MKPEDEAITDDEWLIRLVWESRVTSRTPTIGASSFEPRNDETGGISFYRRSCLDDPTEVLKPFPEDRRPRYAIVMVSVLLIRELGYSVAPDPREDVAGHVIIPEINAIDFKANKRQFVTPFFRLAVEASDHIIRRPLV